MLRGDGGARGTGGDDSAIRGVPNNVVMMFVP